ncbi:hypothetical protein CVT25_001016 [Psilocybe cyanescens]|uniref:F-box domain-containing protein n=1 Tax=Psilocybe cyanescens TaxID=93625 RepID=A0A409WZ81_PSICY|nr:hypothetical protein CVT25_001016 [Psilocybe cyanescens]
MHKWDTSPKASQMFMVLSPEPRAFQAFPTLPVELVDDIVDKACRMLDKSSVSSIALTSHSFRIRANRSRFSSLVLSGNKRNIPHTARGITTLANVIRSGQSITTTPGICTFATSFTLTITGYDFMVKPILNNGCLAFIFNNLFRPLPPSASSLASAGGTRSLFLHISHTSRRKHARPDRVSWGAINSELRQALENLLRFSELNRFSVEAMCDIPSDFLQGSKLKHLSLRRVSITPTSLNCDSTTPEKSAIILKSLDIDNSISWKDIKMVTHPHFNASVSPCNTLSGLTQLSMEAVGADTYKNLNEVLRNAPALRLLALRLSFGLSKSFEPALCCKVTDTFCIYKETTYRTKTASQSITDILNNSSPFHSRFLATRLFP